MKSANESDFIEAVRAARAKQTPLEIVGNATKRGFGRPVSGEVLDVSALAGIVTYEPEELILTAKPGTPIAELDAVLAEKGQRLGFEPAEWAPLFDGGATTIGGAVSVDASGSARVRFGGPRDQLLGIRAVNGFGEAFKAGGRVVKNVTGFDIPKLACGAFGTLAVLTELTFRVFPKPPHTAVLVLEDIEPKEAFTRLRKVWSSPLEATGLAYVPAATRIDGLSESGRGAALIRLEGARAPLDEKIAHLHKLLEGAGSRHLDDGERVFRAIASGTPFARASSDLWRAFIPPAGAAALAEAVAPHRWVADWAGGMFWIETKPGDDATALRATIEQLGGHAVLVRAGAETRARLSVFPPESPERAALTRAVKSAFDPLALFNRGRMYEGI
jgi:glycolate dehydrogenase FAD-binding subunit